MTALAPLENPRYQPKHPPIDGRVPDVVEKWGPRSQLRWFDRYRSQLRPMPPKEWNRFYCSSTQHRGGCCYSCGDDRDMGFDDLGLEHCCCYALGDD